MIDDKVIANIFELALVNGGDLAEIFAERRESNSVNMINGVVEKANWGVDAGVGLRIIYGTNAIYAYVNEFEAEKLYALAKEAADALKVLANIVSADNAININRISAKNAHPFLVLPSSAKKTDIVARLREASDASYKFDKSITQTAGGYAAEIQDVLIANSKGVCVEDRRIRTRVALSAVASDANEKQTGSESPGARKGYEFLESLNMRELGESAARVASTMLRANYAPAGKMPVVIGNAFGGVIFHEACGHSLEATGVAKGASEFAGKKGELIAAPCVTAIDDGTIPNSWGSLNIDDEGAPTQKNILIKDGVLTSYLIDALGGIRMGEASTGSGRRESYKYAPTSRMTNTYIDNGANTPEEIIASTDYGLYAAKMGGGSVEPATGDFNFAVLEGYMIRNGKIAEPVRGASLIGRGGEVLKNIEMVGNDLERAQGMCGSISGAVPTDVGQPTIKVKELTVGGRG